MTENEKYQLAVLLQKITPEMKVKAANTFKTIVDNQKRKGRETLNVDIVRHVLDSIIVEIRFPNITEDSECQD